MPSNDGRTRRKGFPWRRALVLLLLQLAVAGCGVGSPGTPTSAPGTVVGPKAATSSAAATQSTVRTAAVAPSLPAEQAATTGSSTVAHADASDLTPVFREIAVAVAPMPVYGLVRLPAGAEVARSWWPAIDLSDPASYQGKSVANPHIAGADSAQPQAQLLLQMGEGWIVVFENFRGDLGENAGKRVGTVGGKEAILCNTNGGTLVQWSNGGRWFGVFGRGIGQQVVVEIALAAQLIEPETSD